MTQESILSYYDFETINIIYTNLSKDNFKISCSIIFFHIYENICHLNISFNYSFSQIEVSLHPLLRAGWVLCHLSQLPRAILWYSPLECRGSWNPVPKRRIQGVSFEAIPLDGCLRDIFDGKAATIFHGNWAMGNTRFFDVPNKSIKIHSSALKHPRDFHGDLNLIGMRG